MSVQIFLAFTVVFVAVAETEGQEKCPETPVCEYGFIPMKLCGKWACYGAYNEIHQDWRGYWGVTHVCEYTFPGSYAISIHCKEENEFAQKTYGKFFIGLHIPENLGYSKDSFRWTDGSPLDYVDWAKAGQGSPTQQPNNDLPGHIERVVVFKNHWHDILWDPNIRVMVCKKAPTKFNNVCPKPAPPPPPPPDCSEKPVCEFGFIPMKLCGKWACYGAYNEIHQDWRGYWGVTHVCEWTFPGSFAISIHCKEENEFAQKNFGKFFTGLHIPENLGYNKDSFRWTDGSPLDYVDWAKPGQGSPTQQPNNDLPGHIERVVVFKNHWHDILWDPNIRVIVCKKPPIRIENHCPTTLLPAEMETIQMDDVPIKLPLNDVKTPKPSSNRSCRI